MFAATEQERAAAQVLLDLLPNELRTTDEQIQWQTDIWLNAPSVAQLALSPAGRQILEMVGNSKPLAKDDIVNRDAILAPEPAAPAEPAIPPLQPPPGPSDDLAVRLQQDHDAKVERERNAPPRKWDMLKPSAPDKSLKPLPPDESFDDNSPIY